MRQWFIPTFMLCARHLCGEHVEHHMFVGSINKGIDVSTYVRTKLLIPKLLEWRHQMIVDRMIERGFKHRSPLPKIKPTKGEMEWKIPEWSIRENILDLHKRCIVCRSISTGVNIEREAATMEAIIKRRLHD